MKRTFKNILPIVLLLATAQLFAQDGDKEKKEKKRYEFFRERNISKTYPAAGNTLNIDNQFGEVKITTWDKNEIKIDIHIETSSTQKDLADKSFERIDVTDKQEGKNISFKTIMNKGGKEENIGCKNCSNTMSIDYDIHMPANNALNIENSFGSIVIPDYNGVVSLTNKYGSLKAGKLSKPEKVLVEFGSADLKSIGNIDLTFKYSSVTIGSLTGNSKLKFEFCGYSKINLDNGLTGLTVNDSYSSIHLVPAANLSATYNISTSYGSLIDKTNIGINRTDSPEKYGPDLNKHYEGKSGTGTIKIDVKSSFGNIMIGEGTKADMKEKKKVRT
ncbi:MAG TPA: hypothetical protein VGQ04_07765 [Chitinophagaceae bacterium]|nr:hypothetical protein [Chitinophagaceae bacterium]